MRDKLALYRTLTHTKIFADPCQFAYCTKRGVDDAVTTLLHNIQCHLDQPKTYVRTLFFDFSSAFNTLQPHKVGSEATEHARQSTLVPVDQ